MSRNSGGTYSLPVGNPVASLSTITSSWANTTLTDIANALTDSLSRSGLGGMSAPLGLADGSAAAPGLSFVADPDSGFYRPGANLVAIATGGTERVRVSDVGNVNIGGAPSSAVSFSVGKNLTGATTVNGIRCTGTIQSDVTGNAYLFVTNISTVAAAFTLGALTHFSALQNTFGAGSAVTVQTGFEVDSSLTGGATNYGFRGRLAVAAGRWNLFMDGTAANHIAGNLHLGLTGTPASGTAGTLVQSSGVVLNSVDTNGINATLYKPSTPAQTAFLAFVENGSVIGSITRASATTVAYNTSSDRALKEEIAPAKPAGQVIDAIEVVSFKWKGHDSRVDYGVIAQDLQPTFPTAVSEGIGEVPWGVDYSKLVPLLVKELQELRKRVAELEAK